MAVAVVVWQVEKMRNCIENCVQNDFHRSWFHLAPVVPLTGWTSWPATDMVGQTATLVVLIWLIQSRTHLLIWHYGQGRSNNKVWPRSRKLVCLIINRWNSPDPFYPMHVGLFWSSCLIPVQLWWWWSISVGVASVWAFILLIKWGFVLCSILLGLVTIAEMGIGLCVCEYKWQYLLWTRPAVSLFFVSNSWKGLVGGGLWEECPTSRSETVLSLMLTVPWNH